MVNLGFDYVQAILKRGVGEGLKLSPVLLNICTGVALKILAETFEDIGNEADKVRITAFADDITLQSHKRSRIIAALRVLVTLTEPLGLKINVDKSSFTA